MNDKHGISETENREIDRQIAEQKSSKGKPTTNSSGPFEWFDRGVAAAADATIGALNAADQALESATSYTTSASGNTLRAAGGVSDALTPLANKAKGIALVMSLLGSTSTARRVYRGADVAGKAAAVVSALAGDDEEGVKKAASQVFGEKGSRRMSKTRNAVKSKRRRKRKPTKRGLNVTQNI